MHRYLHGEYRATIYTYPLKMKHPTWYRLQHFTQNINSGLHAQIGIGCVTYNKIRVIKEPVPGKSQA